LFRGKGLCPVIISAPENMEGAIGEQTCDFVAISDVLKNGIPAASSEESPARDVNVTQFVEDITRVMRLPEDLHEMFFKYSSSTIWNLVEEVETERILAGRKDFEVLLAEDDPLVLARLESLKPFLSQERVHVEVHSLGLVIPNISETQCDALSSAVNGSAFPLFAAWCFDECGGRVEVEEESVEDSDEDSVGLNDESTGVLKVMVPGKDSEAKLIEEEKFSWNVFFQGPSETLKLENSEEEETDVYYWLPLGELRRQHGRIARECEQVLRFITAACVGVRSGTKPPGVMSVRIPNLREA
jgi:hypothetical protein